MKLENFFNPRSIAVIGASNDRTKIGNQIILNIKANGYAGGIFPINLKDETVEGFPASKSVGAVGQAVDLAVIAIPSDFVMGAVEECAAHGVKNIIIISAGFSEAGQDGRRREEDLARLAAKHSLNILGPNCLGIINTGAGLNATFARSKNKSGQIAFISQSGAICSAALDWAQDKDVGFSKFVSLGNKSVLDENDFFDFLADDPETRLVIAYLEEIADGERFMASLSRLALKKPVAVLKAGQTEAGAKAALSHTGSLAGSYAAVASALERAGAIILDSLEEMFDLVLFHERRFKIRNGDVYIISNAGGPLVIASDQLAKKRLRLGEFSKSVAAGLGRDLPPLVRPANPLDIIGDAQAGRYEIALEAIMKDEAVSNVLVLLTPQTATEIEKTAKIIAAFGEKYPDKLIGASFIGGESLREARQILNRSDIINFDFPDRFINILEKLIKNCAARQKLKAYAPAKAKKRPAAAAESGRAPMDYLESFKLLKKAGIAIVPPARIDSDAALAKIKYPAVLKAVGQNLIHKSDRKAIVLDLKNRAEAAKARRGLAKLLAGEGNYAVAQPMIRAERVEIILGIKRDPSFGPVMMVGLGGIYAEVFRDFQVQAGRIDKNTALAMIRQLKIFPILAGARGQAGYDIGALAETIVKLDALARGREDIMEMDINPFFLYKKGGAAADARMIINS